MSVIKKILWVQDPKNTRRKTSILYFANNLLLSSIKYNIKLFLMHAIFIKML